MDTAHYCLFDFDKKMMAHKVRTALSDKLNEINEIIALCDTDNPATLFDYYAFNVSYYKNSNPLLAFDYVLEAISNQVFEENADSSSLLLSLFLMYSLNKKQEEVICYKWDDIFRSNFWGSKSEKRKAGLLLLRILAMNCESLVYCNNYEARIIDFLTEAVSDITNKLKVSKKEQGYENIIKFHDFHKTLHDAWSHTDKNISTHNENDRHKINRIFGVLKNDCNYLINFQVLTDFPESLYEMKERFVQSLSDGHIAELKDEVESFMDYIGVVINNNSYYTLKYVMPLVLNYFDFIDNNIDKINKPSVLTIEPVERMYPFFDINADVVLRIKMMNIGGGLLQM